MADGIFNIPMSEYYSKSSDFKGKVSELITSVENNFLNKVRRNIGTLDPRDSSVVEDFASYTEAKSQLESLKDYETKLNNMSLEGGSNPLYSVVSIDRQYSSAFSDVSKGASSSAVAAVVGRINDDVTFEKEKKVLLSFLTSLTGIKERETVAALLGIDVNDLGKFVKSIADKAKSSHDIAKVLQTLYTGSGKGISFETLLYSKEIGQILNMRAAGGTPNIVEKILTVMMDMPYTLKSLKWAKKLENLVSPVVKSYKHLKTFASVITGEYATGISNVAKDILKSDKLKIGGEVLGWTLLGVEEGVHIYKNYTSSKTNSKTIVGKVGKSVIGGTIDTVSNVGPLDGMWLGAKIGTAVGNPLIGAVAGFGLGTLNLAGSLLFPELKKAAYNFVKDGAFAAVDFVEDRVEDVGKAVNQGINTVKSIGKNVSNFFNGGIKTVSSLFG